MAEEAPPRVWSSRKFVSAWCLTWLATCLFIWFKLTGEAWSSTVSLVWLGYFAGNVGDRFLERKKE